MIFLSSARMVAPIVSSFPDDSAGIRTASGFTRFEHTLRLVSWPSINHHPFTIIDNLPLPVLIQTTSFSSLLTYVHLRF